MFSCRSRAFHALCFCLCVALDPTLASAASTLRVAALSIVDALPLHVAQGRGLFTDEGAEVEIIRVSSGLERDQLMQVGEVDGMLTELTTTAYFNRNETKLIIVTAARTAMPGRPLFRVLAAKDSGLKVPADLVGKNLGVSKNTIIEYVSERLLASANVDAAAVDFLSTPNIMERFTLLTQGRITAATLPDPLAFSAMSAGAINLIDDGTRPEYAISVYAFSAPSLQKNPKAIRGFTRALDQAAAMINAAPETFRPDMLKAIRVPENVKDSYPIPGFPRACIPTREQWNDVLAWMRGKELLSNLPAYANSISSDYLP